jgi:nitroimidazol reductase NimA-like FMN-containing flavoprotein (pyridoxamine 5'-phosphate oxidase superfamily)
MRVQVTPMDRPAAEALLQRHHVGRLAFSFHDRVTIRLVNYAFADGWIYARMAESDGVATVRHNEWVALEAGEVHGIYDWCTVTVNGSVHFLNDGGAPPPSSSADRHAYDEAVRQIQRVVPAVFTADDPVPTRAHLYRIHVDGIMALEAHSSPREGRRS